MAPSPRALLLKAQLPTRNRVSPTVEFGAAGVEALVSVDFTRFFTERPLAPQAVVPVNYPPPLMAPVAINVSARDQYDPIVFARVNAVNTAVMVFDATTAAATAAAPSRSTPPSARRA